MGAPINIVGGIPTCFPYGGIISTRNGFYFGGINVPSSNMCTRKMDNPISMIPIRGIYVPNFGFPYSGAYTISIFN
jgi:hypothetical protein